METTSSSIDAALTGIQRWGVHLEVEQIVLGFLMEHNNAYQSVSGFLLESHHFADPTHRRIYQSIEAGFRDGHVVDVAALSAQFDPAGLLDEVGGPDYLHTLVELDRELDDLIDLAIGIHSEWAWREYLEISCKLLRAVYNRDLDGVDVLRLALGLVDKNLTALWKVARLAGRPAGGHCRRVPLDAETLKYLIEYSDTAQSPSAAF
jgi:hypothetical protein